MQICPAILKRAEQETITGQFFVWIIYSFLLCYACQNVYAMGGVSNMVLLWGLGILNVDSVMFCRLFYMYVSANDSLALVKMSSTDANGRG
jgi:hypothetical protein